MLIFLTVILMIFSSVAALDDLTGKISHLKTNLAKMESKNKIDPNEHDSLENGLEIMSSIDTECKFLDGGLGHKFTPFEFLRACAENDFPFLLSKLDEIKTPPPTQETKFPIIRYKNLEKISRENMQSIMDKSKEKTVSNEQELLNILEYSAKERGKKHDKIYSLDRINTIAERLADYWNYLPLDDLMDIYNLRWRKGYTAKNPTRNAELLKLYKRSLEEIRELGKNIASTVYYHHVPTSGDVINGEIFSTLCMNPFLPEALKLETFDLWKQLIIEMRKADVENLLTLSDYVPSSRPLPDRSYLSIPFMQTKYPEHYNSKRYVHTEDISERKIDRLREFVKSGFVTNAAEFGYTGSEYKPVGQSQRPQKTLRML